MNRIPLPTCATFRASENIARLAPQPIRPFANVALDWLRQRFGPLPQDEDPDDERQPGDDEVSQEYEEEERMRPVEMSRICVPILRFDSPEQEPSGSPINTGKKEKDQRGSKNGNSIHEEEVYSTPPESPIKTPTSMPHPEAELILIFPTSSPLNTRSTSPFTITGSAFIMPIKTHISTRSQGHLETQLSEAISCDFFKMWPTLEDPRPHGAARRKADESGIYEWDLNDGERKRKEALLREWQAKGERDSAGRRFVRRRKGWDEGVGWESVVEDKLLTSLEWFRPTLEGFAPTLGDGEDEESWEEKGVLKEAASVKAGRNQEERDGTFQTSDGRRKYGEVLLGGERRKRPSTRAPTPLAKVHEVGSWEEKGEERRVPDGEQHRVRKSSRIADGGDKDALYKKGSQERSSTTSRKKTKPAEGEMGEEIEPTLMKSGSKHRTETKSESSKESTKATTKVRTRSKDRKAREGSDSDMPFDSKGPRKADRKR